MARSSGLISFSGSMTLRAQGLLTLIRSQTLVSPALSRLIMVGSLVEQFRLDGGARLGAEGIEHLRRVVALPAQDIQLLGTLLGVGWTEPGRGAAECGSAGSEKPHDVPARELDHGRTPL